MSNAHWKPSWGLKIQCPHHSRKCYQPRYPSTLSATQRAHRQSHDRSPLDFHPRFIFFFSYFSSFLFFFLSPASAVTSPSQYNIYQIYFKQQIQRLGLAHRGVSVGARGGSYSTDVDFHGEWCIATIYIRILCVTGVPIRFYPHLAVYRHSSFLVHKNQHTDLTSFCTWKSIV